MATIATVASITALALSLVNFVVTLWLTLKRDVGSIRPVLIFVYRSEGWHIENVGNGPALDVVFHRLAGESVTQSVRLPALSKGGVLCLHFARHDSKQIFAATYRDVNERPYTSRSQHDLSTVTNKFAVQRPSNPEDLPRSWQLADMP